MSCVPSPSPWRLPWVWRADTTHHTVTLTVTPGTDYMTVRATAHPHPEDWAQALGVVSLLCPESPCALGLSEPDGDHDIWTPLIHMPALRALLGLLGEPIVRPMARISGLMLLGALALCVISPAHPKPWLVVPVGLCEFGLALLALYLVADAELNPL